MAGGLPVGSAFTSVAEDLKSELPRKKIQGVAGELLRCLIYAKMKSVKTSIAKETHEFPRNYVQDAKKRDVSRLRDLSRAAKLTNIYPAFHWLIGCCNKEWASACVDLDWVANRSKIRRLENKFQLISATKASTSHRKCTQCKACL